MRDVVPFFYRNHFIANAINADRYADPFCLLTRASAFYF
jgi:hypothetical protein